MLQFFIKIIALIISILTSQEPELNNQGIGQLYQCEQQQERVDLISPVKTVHLNKNETI